MGKSLTTLDAYATEITPPKAPESRWREAQANPAPPNRVVVGVAGEIHEGGPFDHGVGRHEPRVAAVRALRSVVAQDEVVPWGDNNRTPGGRRRVVARPVDGVREESTLPLEGRVGHSTLMSVRRVGLRHRMPVDR